MAPAAVPLPATQKLKDPTRVQNTWASAEYLRHHELERDCADHIEGLYRHLPPETQRDALNAIGALFDEQIIRLGGAVATMRFGPPVQVEVFRWVHVFEGYFDLYFGRLDKFRKQCLHITELSGVGGCQVERPRLLRTAKRPATFEFAIELVPGPGWAPLLRTSEAAPVRLEPPLQPPLPHLQ